MEPTQLSHVMSEATAPAFVLGAVAAFDAILFNRMTAVIERIRSLNEIAAEDTARAHLKSDIPRLRQRAKLLNSAVYLAIIRPHVRLSTGRPVSQYAGNEGCAG
jgi:hypothetical protein